MTSLAQFRTAISGKLGLDNTAAGIDQTAMDTWCNEAVNDILTKTRCSVTSSSSIVSLSAGVGDYTLSTSVLRTLDVTLASGGMNYSLERLSPQDILRHRTLATVTGSPIRYYAVAGNDLFMVYPSPSTGDTVTFYYVPRPSALSVSSDSPSTIPAEWHKLVEWYALSEGAAYDDNQVSQYGQTYRQRYEIGLRELKKAVVYKGGSHLAPAIPNRRRKRLVPNHPSQDVW